MRKRSVQIVLAWALAVGMSSWCVAAAPKAPKAKQPKPVKAASAAPEYDVLYQVYVPTFAETIAAAIKEGIQKDLARQRPLEPDQLYALRKQVGQGFLESVPRAVKEVENFRLGWRLDRAEKRTYLDLTLTALPGTGLAREFAKLSGLKTAFGGFAAPDAALAAHWTGQMPAADAARAARLVETGRDKAIRKIGDEAISDDDKKVRKELANKLFDVMRDTAASGRSDGALSLVVRPEEVRLLFGAYVADGAKLESVVKPVAEFFQTRHPLLAGLKLDADSAAGVNFHTLDLPAPHDRNREKFIQVFGESLQVVVGFGKEAVYVAVGRDALKSLKEAIQKSATTSAAGPFEVSLALKPVADFIAAIGKEHEKDQAKKIADVLRAAGGKDHLRLSVQPIERGATLRLDAEEGVLQLIGTVSPKAKAFLLGK